LPEALDENQSLLIKLKLDSKMFSIIWNIVPIVTMANAIYIFSSKLTSNAQAEKTSWLNKTRVNQVYVMKNLLSG
jgi:hypothetical protein